MWKNINEINPDGGIFLNGVYYTNEQIIHSDLSHLQKTIYKPVREMIESELTFTYYSNGDLLVKNTYNVFPSENIDNKPLLNVYGFKILNNIKEKKLNEI